MISNSVSAAACQNMFLLEKSFKKYEKKVGDILGGSIFSYKDFLKRSQI